MYDKEWNKNQAPERDLNRFFWAKLFNDSRYKRGAPQMRARLKPSVQYLRGIQGEWDFSGPLNPPPSRATVDLMGRGQKPH